MLYGDFFIFHIKNEKIFINGMETFSKMKDNLLLKLNKYFSIKLYTNQNILSFVEEARKLLGYYKIQKTTKFDILFEPNLIYMTQEFVEQNIDNRLHSFLNILGEENKKEKDITIYNLNIIDSLKKEHSIKIDNKFLKEIEEINQILNKIGISSNFSSELLNVSIEKQILTVINSLNETDLEIEIKNIFEKLNRYQ